VIATFRTEVIGLMQVKIRLRKLRSDLLGRRETVRCKRPIADETSDHARENRRALLRHGGRTHRRNEPIMR